MTFDTRVEDEDGYFTLWSGKHDPLRVKTLDLYLRWRDGEGREPPLAAMSNLEVLRVPLAIFRPEPLLRLPRLRTLEIMMGNGEPLPEGLFELTQLEELDLCSNFLSSLPAGFARLSRLRRLDLSANGLDELPPLPASLVDLDAGSNQLRRVRALPPSLKRLDLGSNPLEELALPASLEELDLYGSRILPALPPSLRILKLGSCELHTPPDLTGFAALRELWLQGNPLEGAWLDRLPGGIEKLWGPRLGLGDLWRFPRLRELDLGGLSLGPAPSLAELPPELVELNLGGTGIGTLPSRLQQLPLRKLHLDSLGAVEIPPISTLETLSASSCQLTEVPPSILALRSLLELNLDNNQLTHLPDEIDALTNLRRLHLRSNRLTSLPDGFAGLVNLEQLDLVANQLTVFPAVLRRLPKLHHVQLHANPTPMHF